MPAPEPRPALEALGAQVSRLEGQGRRRRGVLPFGQPTASVTRWRVSVLPSLPLQDAGKNQATKGPAPMIAMVRRMIALHVSHRHLSMRTVFFGDTGRSCHGMKGVYAIDLGLESGS